MSKIEDLVYELLGQTQKLTRQVDELEKKVNKLGMKKPKEKKSDE